MTGVGFLDELVEERWASATDPETRVGNARMGGIL